MKKIIKCRGEGKTTELIKLSATTQIPIVAMTQTHAHYISEKAKELNLKIPDPIGVANLYLLIGKSEKRVLIDEAESVLQMLIGHPIYAASFTKPKEISKDQIAYLLGMAKDDFVVVE